MVHHEEHVPVSVKWRAESIFSINMYCGERIYFCYIRLLHNEWCNQASVFTEKRGKSTKNNLNIFPVDEIKHTSGHARLL